MLKRPELVQFAQRIASDFHLRPFNQLEVQDYIEHRVRHAGAKHRIFTNRACALVAEATNGIPRLVNILCDTALVYGFSSNQRRIDTDIIEEVLRDKSEYGIFTFNDSNKVLEKDEEEPKPTRSSRIVSLD